MYMHICSLAFYHLSSHLASILLVNAGELHTFRPIGVESKFGTENISDCTRCLESSRGNRQVEEYVRRSKGRNVLVGMGCDKCHHP